MEGFSPGNAGLRYCDTSIFIELWVQPRERGVKGGRAFRESRPLQGSDPRRTGSGVPCWMIFYFREPGFDKGVCIC